MALFSYPVCTWLCQYVNMGVRKWLEKSAEKQKYKMRKTANPLSRKAFRAVSFSATKDKGKSLGDLPFLFCPNSTLCSRLQADEYCVNTSYKYAETLRNECLYSFLAD